MKILRWINKNTKNLKGKTVAISGATGGIGCKLCRYLSMLEADLILLDRNTEKSINLINDLKKEFPLLNATHININLSDFTSVKIVTQKLKNIKFDYIIFNAGAYSVPRKICDTGYNNIFQINFLSPYYMIKELSSNIKNKNIKFVVVGSIAHNYSKIDITDIDFSKRKAASKVYGNAKRFLMYATMELYKNEKRIAITHPGITFTNITAHYPKLIFAVIKHPMKIIFMRPQKAALSILYGIFKDTGYHEWIGPNWFNIWGIPKLKRLKTCSEIESIKIFNIAEQIYKSIK